MFYFFLKDCWQNDSLLGQGFRRKNQFRRILASHRRERIKNGHCRSPDRWQGCHLAKKNCSFSHFLLFGFGANLRGTVTFIEKELSQKNYQGANVRSGTIFGADLACLFIKLTSMNRLSIMMIKQTRLFRQLFFNKTNYTVSNLCNIEEQNVTPLIAPNYNLFHKSIDVVHFCNKN